MIFLRLHTVDEYIQDYRDHGKWKSQNEKKSSRPERKYFQGLQNLPTETVENYVHKKLFLVSSNDFNEKKIPHQPT